MIHDMPVEPKRRRRRAPTRPRRRCVGRGGRAGRRGRGSHDKGRRQRRAEGRPSPKDVAAMAKAEPPADEDEPERPRTPSRPLDGRAEPSPRSAEPPSRRPRAAEPEADEPGAGEPEPTAGARRPTPSPPPSPSPSRCREPPRRSRRRWSPGPVAAAPAARPAHRPRPTPAPLAEQLAGRAVPCRHHVRHGARRAWCRRVGARRRPEPASPSRRRRRARADQEEGLAQALSRGRGFAVTRRGSVLLILGALSACPCLRHLCDPAPTIMRPTKETAVYAIVRAGAKQQKVAVGDVIEIDKVSTASATR